MIPNKYNPENVEDKWYSYWMEHGYFHSRQMKKKPIQLLFLHQM